MKKLIFAAILIIIAIPFRNLSAMEAAWTQQAHSGEILRFKYSSDGKYIFTIGKDSSFKKWDAETGILLYEKKIPLAFTTADVTSDGKIIFMGYCIGYDKYTINIFKQNIDEDTVSLLVNQYISELYDNTIMGGFNMQIILPPDDKYLYVLTGIDGQYLYGRGLRVRTGRIHKFNYLTNNLETVYGSLYDKIYCFSKNIKYFAYSDRGGHETWYNPGYEWIEDYGTNIYDISNNKYSQIIQEYNKILSFSYDSKYLLAVTEKNQLKVWSVPDINLIKTIDLTSKVSDIKSTNDLLIVGCTLPTQESSIQVRHFITNTLVDSVIFPISQNIKLEIAPDSQSILSVSSNGVMSLWKTKYQTDGLTADFSSDKNFGTRPFKIQFYNLSIGKIESWNWDFGDGQTSSEENPLHNYGKAGKFNVRLIVSDGISNDTITKKEYIEITDFVKDTKYSLDSVWSNKSDRTYINPLEYSSDGTLLYAYDNKHKISIYNSSDGIIYDTIGVWNNSDVIDFSEDKQKIIAVREDNYLCYQKLKDTTCLTIFYPNFEIYLPGFDYADGIKVFQLQLFKDNSMLLVVSGIHCHFEYVPNAPYYDDGWYKHVEIISIDKGTKNDLQPYPIIDNGYDYKFSESENNLFISITSLNNFSLTILDSSYNEILQKSYDKPMTSLKFSKDSKYLFIGTSNGIILRMDMQDFNKIDTIYQYASSVNFIDISVQGDYLITCHADNTINILDIAAKKQVDYAKLPSAITSLAVSPAGKQFAAGCADGNIWVWKSDYIVASPGDIPTEKNNNVNSPEVFPNPFTNTTRFKYRLTEPSQVRLTIYDCLGCVIVNLINDYKKSGSNEETFNASGLAAGIYFYKLQIGNSFFSGKIVKLIE